MLSSHAHGAFRNPISMAFRSTCAKLFIVLRNFFRYLPYHVSSGKQLELNFDATEIHPDNLIKVKAFRIIIAIFGGMQGPLKLFSLRFQPFFPLLILRKFLRIVFRVVTSRVGISSTCLQFLFRGKLGRTCTHTNTHIQVCGNYEMMYLPGFFFFFHPH